MIDLLLLSLGMLALVAGIVLVVGGLIWIVASWGRETFDEGFREVEDDDES